MLNCQVKELQYATIKKEFWKTYCSSLRNNTVLGVILRNWYNRLLCRGHGGFFLTGSEQHKDQLTEREISRPKQFHNHH